VVTVFDHGFQMTDLKKLEPDLHMGHWFIQPSSRKEERLADDGWVFVTASPLSVFERKAINTYCAEHGDGGQTMYAYAEKFWEENLAHYGVSRFWLKNVAFSSQKLADDYRTYLDGLPKRVHVFLIHKPITKDIRKRLIGVNWMMSNTDEDQTWIFSIEDHPASVHVIMFLS
jgi:hypothetical protein